MSVRSLLFNIPVTTRSTTLTAQATVGPRTFGAQATAEGAEGGGGGAVTVTEQNTADQKTVGAFITVQSLVSFTGATAVTSGLWSAARSLLPASFPTIYVGVVICLLIGFVIYLINISDKTAAPDGRAKTIALVIAFLNTVILFNATRAIIGA